MKTIFVIVFLSAFSTIAFAQNCQSMPPGPDRRACAMRNPMFQAKYARCSQLLEQRGFNGPAKENPGVGPFFRSCMQGRQQ